MPDSDPSDTVVVVVDVDALQLAALRDGCPQGNIYSGVSEQPTRQGLREPKDLRRE